MSGNANGAANALCIERVEATALRMPLPKPLRAASATITDRCTVLVRIYTRDGICGACFANNEDAGQRAILRIIEEEIAPILVGRSAFLIEARWAEMYAATRDILRDRRMALRAVACVDAALWDVVGKAANVPLYMLWGGYRDEVPAIAMGGYYREDNDLGAVAREAEQLRLQGFAGCKLKVGKLDPRGDAERVRAARDGAGPGFKLMPDPNQAWSFEQALEFIRRVEEFDITWVEEPCYWENDRDVLPRLRQRTGTAICAGQSEITKAGCLALLRHGAIDYCNFDPSWGGGPTEWLKVGSLAEMFGVGILSHLEPQLGASLAAAVPNGAYVELMQPDRDPLYHRLLSDPPRIRNGVLELNNGAGWGWTIDEKVERRLRG